MDTDLSGMTGHLLLILYICNEAHQRTEIKAKLKQMALMQTGLQNTSLMGFDVISGTPPFAPFGLRHRIPKSAIDGRFLTSYMYCLNPIFSWRWEQI